jgi:hypothetical protein
MRPPRYTAARSGLQRAEAAQKLQQKPEPDEHYGGKLKRVEKDEDWN